MADPFADVVGLTRRLIDVPSVSGEEGAVMADVARLLEAGGYRVECIDAVPGRPNVFAAVGEPRIVLSTHLDTVPPFIPSAEDDEHIYGRGATDAKGIAAAQMVAANALRKDGLEDIGLLFVVDEEVASVGARAANRHPWAASCRYLINGEPTENQLAVAAKGSLHVEIHATGTGGHAAYPERGRSAVHELLAVLQDLLHADWPSEETFGRTTLNIGKVSGGSAPNVLAPDAHALVQFRCATDPDRVLTRLSEVVGTRASVRVGSATPPMRLKAMGDLPTCVVAYTTDLPHMSAWGTPLLFGPGSIADAHMPNERIAKVDLVTGVARYIEIVRSLVAST